MNRIAEALGELADAMKDAGFKEHEFGLAMTREAKMKVYWSVAKDDPFRGIDRPMDRDKIAGVQIIEFKEKDRG
jgi:hypothetical protein